MMNSPWHVDVFMKFLPVGDTRARFGFRASSMTLETVESRGLLGNLFLGQRHKQGELLEEYKYTFTKEGLDKLAEMGIMTKEKTK